MAIKNYSAAAETLIQLSGGKENFITVENCATRVRIQYKDLSKVDKKAIGEMDGVLSVIEKDGLQVVVGPGVCNKLCAAINEILSVDRAASTAAPDAPDVPEEKKKGNFLKIISDIFVPVLPAMIAGGIVQGLNTPPSKRTSFTSTMRSPGSNFWTNMADPCCENRTFWIPLSVAIFRLQLPVCWQTESMARTTTRKILRAISISSASTHGMQPTTA